MPRKLHLALRIATAHSLPARALQTERKLRLFSKLHPRSRLLCVMLKA